MERGFESWFQNQKVNWQSPDQNPPSAPTIPSFGNTVSPATCDPCGWFYGMPRHRRGFVPAVNKEQDLNPNMGTIGGQKKFLVFDQSRDQTTLFYSSGVGPAPIRYQFRLPDNPKPQSGSSPIHVNEYSKQNDEKDSRSKMREDPVELDALLYSDDDDFDYSENEETSTAHSPWFLEGQNGNLKEEEVASSGGYTKKHKREDKGIIVKRTRAKHGSR